ncbi:hypothetical protein [Salinibacter ruber]|uniref:hypothetical protein n=1 Tax=Salinibacter ruber TaxID=146919 RepID=UPI00207377CA|nr:hypothetical protein [Salinibacter ruber]
MEIDLELLGDILEAYEEFDHHNPPDLPAGPGVLTENAAPLPADRLRPADRIVQERVEESEPHGSPRQVRERERRTVYHHVGLLIEGELLVEQQDFYEDLSVLESPESHDVHVLTLKGHQLLDRLSDASGGDSDVGFAVS